MKHLSIVMGRRNFLHLSSGLVAEAALVSYVPPTLQAQDISSGKNPILFTHLEENMRIGSTPIGETAWQRYGPDTVYVDVDTSSAGFPHTPWYLTSLGGYYGHDKTLGASSIYDPKANGFRMYIRDPDRPNLTPADANAMRWHITWLGIEVTKWNISPWWNNGNRPEISENMDSIIPGRTPIKYPAIWDREREILEYNPRFLPNTVTFDPKNRPVIRVGVHDVVGEHVTVYYSRVWVQEVYMQTLNASGQWIALSLSRVMQDKIPDWQDDRLYSGIFQAEERVVFDASGDAYTVVKTQNHGEFLLHSQDDMETWEVYALPVEGVDRYRIEMTASDRPPVIFVLKNDALSIIVPEKRNDGTLNTLSMIDLVAQDTSDGPSHSGVGDLTVTLNNQTHVVYISTIPVVGQVGTSQYIVTYNHDDQTVTAPVLLGTTASVEAGPTDVHNGPAIVADSQGFLHVVLGAHQHPFKYRVSKRPNDATEWEELVELSNPTEKEAYVSLVIDKADTLHLVSRMQNDEEMLSLHYMRKKRSDSAWVDIGELVIPKPEHYSIWYHKLTIDRRGTLFLAYFYYSHNLTCPECRDYQRKWHDEGVTCREEEETDKGCELDRSRINAHDPVILMSGDGGDSWKIATTQDFQEGMP